MFQNNWDLSLILYLSAVFADELPVPENVTLLWKSEFSVLVKWREPSGLDPHCVVNYTFDVVQGTKCATGNKPHQYRTKNLEITENVTTEDGVCFVLRTNPMSCGSKTQSQPTTVTIPPHEALVKNFSCIMYSSEKMNCTWHAVNQVPDLQLNYWNDTLARLEPCLTYINNSTARTGCHLRGNFQSYTTFKPLFFLINGTQNHSVVNNTFQKCPSGLAHPLPPRLTISREGKNLNLQWSPSEFDKQCIEYIYSYKKCKEDQIEKRVADNNVHVEYDPACQYRFKVKTIYIDDCGTGESDWSKEIIFGEDNDPNLSSVVAAIVIPLTLLFFIILALVMFRRYKHIILPTVPKPGLFLKDMFNSPGDIQGKGLGVGGLYVPVEEVVASKVSVEPYTASQPLDQ